MSTKLFLALLILNLSTSGCATWKSYNDTVAARQDTLAGYAKDGGYGGKIIHRVEYR